MENFNMFRLIQLICFAVFAAALVPNIAQAELLVYEGFDYTEGTSLIGQNEGDGWASAWTGSVDGNSYATISAGSLVDGGGNYLATAGASGTSSGNGMYVREFDQTLTGTIYVSYFGRSDNDMIRRFALNLGAVSNGSFSYDKSNWIGQVVDAYGSSDPRPDTEESLWGVAYSYSPIDYTDTSATELSLLVAAVDIDNGVIDLYVLDPSEAYPTSLPSTADATLDFGGSLGTINGIRYFVGGRDVSGSTVTENYAEASIDELRIGTTWSDVVSVPEPSTLALFVTGMIGLLAYAWRKRK